MNDTSIEVLYYQTRKDSNDSSEWPLYVELEKNTNYVRTQVAIHLKVETQNHIRASSWIYVLSFNVNAQFPGILSLFVLDAVYTIDFSVYLLFNFDFTRFVRHFGGNE